MAELDEEGTVVQGMKAANIQAAVTFPIVSAYQVSGG